MSALAPSTLDSTALTLRLRELAGEERDVQVDFLLHLEEFDRRRAYVDAGHPSLWAYCLEVLHLREGSAGRRIQAMRVLRRFPRLEHPLRDGRLCLSTVQLLGQVVTEENLDDLVARAAFRTKAEVDHLVASVQARPAPRPGLRRMPEREEGTTTATPVSPTSAGAERAEQADTTLSPATSISCPPACAAATVPQLPREQRKARPEIHAVTQSEWSLRVTIDVRCKEDLETLKCLLAHKIPDGDLAAVLHEAIRCAVDKHGKRKGAVAPERKAPPTANRAEPRTTIPAIVRREVWERDCGRCAWTAPDGRRCNSRWMLELDHIQPEALGGPANVANLRLACRAHNLLHAERTYGREHMDRFRRHRERDQSVAARATSEGAPASKQPNLFGP